MWVFYKLQYRYFSLHLSERDRKREIGRDNNEDNNEEKNRFKY